MQYLNGPMYNGLPMDPYGQSQFGINQNQYSNGINTPQIVQQKPPVDPRIFDTPDITMGERHKPLFSVSDSKSNAITVEDPSDAEVEAKKKRKSSKKESSNKPIVRADDAVTGVVEDTSAIYTYNETNQLLHETLGQIDAINSELVQEFNSIRHNRTMKNKYMIINNLSENIGSLISNRIATIKEINNCISKANDLDYKKYKDKEAAQSSMNDDKYISDIYQAFIQNPQNLAPTYNMPKIDPAVAGSGIVRANISQNDINSNNGGIMDIGYLNYVANLTPEQNMMRYEGDPNVKQVVVYDAQTGAKFFQVMNLATGEVIPNVPVYDEMFMQDTTLDLKTKIAKNINLNESFPIVVINDNITSQY